MNQRKTIEAALAGVNELIRKRQLTVVVETPEGSNCCPVVSANLNGNNIDVWLDEKFGSEIRPNKEDEANPQLRAMISELVDVYWGEGDSDPHNPPDIIKRAKRLLKST